VWHARTAAVGQRRVDERLGQVDAPAARPQHALDEVAHLRVGQQRRRQLAATLTRDEHPPRLVDPDLLDRRVVEEDLQRAVARHRVEHRARGVLEVHQRRQCTTQGALVVVGEDLGDKTAYGHRLGHRIQPASPNELTHLVLDDAQGVEPAGRGSRLEDRVHASAPGCSGVFRGR
jgi:hypothetical protein